MPAALDSAGHLSQPRRAVVRCVARACGARSVRVIRRVKQRLPFERAILRDEQEDEAVDQPQKLGVQLRRLERA